MSGKRIRSRPCAYCGLKAVTRDHIPPKALFARPRPNRLITVPSCKECNAQALTDDEYFCLMVSMRHDTAEHPDAAQTCSAALRGLALREKKGLRGTS